MGCVVGYCGCDCGHRRTPRLTEEEPALGVVRHYLEEMGRVHLRHPVHSERQRMGILTGVVLVLLVLLLLRDLVLVGSECGG